MMEANADFIIAIMSQILDVIDIDAFGFWEDMAYNHAPLISPDISFPNYCYHLKRLAEVCRQR